MTPQRQQLSTGSCKELFLRDTRLPEHRAEFRVPPSLPQVRGTLQTGDFSIPPRCSFPSGTCLTWPQLINPFSTPQLPPGLATSLKNRTPYKVGDVAWGSCETTGQKNRLRCLLCFSQSPLSPGEPHLLACLAWQQPRPQPQHGQVTEDLTL